MKRRDFIKAIAGLLGVAVCPAVQGVPDPVKPFKKRIYGNEPHIGFYGWQEQGFAVLDNRRILLGEFDGSEKRMVSADCDTSN